MKHFEIPEHLNDEVDGHLSQSEVFAATVLLRERTGCDIAEAKQAVGETMLRLPRDITAMVSQTPRSSGRYELTKRMDFPSAASWPISR